MAELDIDSLLQAISEDNPSGDNLEYDPAFQELERMALGKPGVYDPVSGQTVGAEEPDWRQVRDLALELSGRTHDLRVAYQLTLALLRLDGLPGLATGLSLIAALASQFWPTLHPDLIVEEDNDPIERINALSTFVDPERFLPWFRATPIVAAPGVGRFNLRDLDLAQGRLEAREGEQVAGLAMLAGAWREGDEEENNLRQQAVEAALAALADIESTCRDQSGSGPDFGELVRQLKSIRNFYAEQTGGAVAEPDSDTAGVAPGALAVAGAQSVGGLATRADAVRVLRQVSDFLKRAEPSSPAPMLIDRSIKLLEMDFVDIVRELMPEAKERIALIGGIKFEESEY